MLLKRESSTKTHSLGRRYILASYPNGTRSYGVVAAEDNTIIKSTLLNETYTRIKINSMAFVGRIQSYHNWSLGVYEVTVIVEL
jgi:hypothetical protein